MKLFATMIMLCLSSTLMAADFVVVNGRVLTVGGRGVYVGTTPAPVDVGYPLAWWKMTNTGTNATDTLDFTTNGYDVAFKPDVPSGPVPDTDGTNDWYIFSGTEWFDAGDQAVFDRGTNTHFSISVWFDKDETEGQGVLVAKQKTTAPNYEGWDCYSMADETLQFLLVGNDGAVNGSQITTIATFSGWTHAVFVYRGGAEASNLEIWANGSMQGVVTNLEDMSSASFANSIPLQIGSRGGSGNLQWQGLIDDTRYFTNALTQTQIENLFTEGRQ